ncbi:MAG: cohesin domain-containing protein [Bacteroidota bacterium]
MEGRYSLLAGILCLFSFTQLFSQVPILTIESEDAATGTELCLDITGDNFDNIFGFQFSVNYDASVLEYGSRTGEILIGAPVNISNPAPGDIRVQWSVFGLEGFTSADPFLIGTVCFNVLSDEETNVVFSSTPITAEVSGQSGPIAGVTYNNGLVNEGNGAVPNDLVFDFGNGQIMPGQTICQDVTVAEFSAITSFQFTVSNPLGAVATPTISNVHPSLTGNLTVSGNNTALISYTHGSTPGVTLADGLTAFSLCHAIPANYSDPGTKVISEGAAGSATTDAGAMIGTDVLSGTASPPAGGSDDFIFDLSDGNGAIGTTVCLDLTVNAFEAVAAMQFSINYDASRLQFQNFDNLAFPTIQASQPSGTPGQVRVSYFYQNADNLGASLPDGSILLSVCFRILDDSETDVVFSNTPIPIEAFNNNGVPFNVITDDGTINAGNGGGPSCNDGIQNGTETGVDCGGSCAPCDNGSDNLSFTIADGSGNAGQQICLDLTTSNYTNIAAWQFSVNFDTDFLAYTNFTANPAFANNFSPLQVTNSADGVLRIVWTDQSPEFLGLTFPDGTVLATLCFTIVDDGPTTVDITNSPIVITAANNMGQALPVDTQGGSVNGGTTPTCNDGIQNGTETGVDCGGSCAPCESCNDGIQNNGETGVDCGGPNCSPCAGGDDLSFTIQPGDGDVGTQVCLDITTTNFTDVTAFQFSVNFDESFLTYDNFTANPDFIANFSPLQVTNSPSNALRVVWVDQSPEFQGLSFPNGTVIATICFTVVDDGQTFVDISGSPISITASDNSGMALAVSTQGGIVNGDGMTPTCNDGIQNGDETGVDCGGSCAPCTTCNDGIQNGDETGVDCGGSCDPCMVMSDDLTFDVQNGAGGIGAQVCLDITTANFTDITAFQFSVNFDESFLTYDNFTANPDFLAAFSPLQVTNSPSDALRVVWVDQSPEFLGLSFADGTVIATICFTVVDDGQTTVDITGSPISITASNNLGQSQDVFVDGGIVNGSTTETCNDGIQNNGETGVDCGGPNCDPCIDPPNCTDGIQNGNETGIDCGGPDCMPCNVMETCDDGILNNGEIEVDCGGPNCAPCNSLLTFDLQDGNGGVGSQVCLDITTANFTDITAFQFSVNFDEAFLSYDNFTANPDFLAAFSPMQVTNSPSNALRIVWVDQSPEFMGLSFPDGTVIATLCFTVLDDDQTPVDITGTPISITASNNLGQSQDVFVSGGIVNGGTTESCNDGIQNNGETDVDCGGPNCAPCPTCNDGVQNGNETGVDCGGPDCDPCINPPTCEDGIQNGQETGVDCGGPDCAACPPTETCDDGILNNGETQIDCGGPNCAPCSDNLTFRVLNGEGGVGTEICLDVVTTNFTDVTAFQFSINFDEAFLNYNSFTANPDFLAAFSPMQVTNSPSDALRVVWVDQSPEFMGLTFPDGTVIASFCFTIEDDCTTTVEITGDPISITGSNNLGQSLAIDVFPGTVNAGCGGGPTCDDGIQNGQETGVDCGGPDCPACPPTCEDGIQNGQETGVDCGGPDCPECPGDCEDGIMNGQETGIDCGGPDCPACPPNEITLTVSNGTGMVGEQVCLDINAFDFNTITDFQFSINYDPTKLQFAVATPNGALTGLTASGATPGQIIVNWSAASGSVTLPNGETILDICYTVIEACTTPVTITNMPQVIEANNAANDDVTVNVSGGVVNNGIPCNDQPDNLIFDIGDGSGGVGSEVCLDITVENFDELTELEFSVSYNSTVLSYNNATNFNLTGLSNANITNPSPGALSFVWESGTPAGETLADGSVMVSICFEVLEAAQTMVTPTAVPTVIIAGNANGQNVGVVAMGGIVNSGFPPPGSGLTFLIGTAEGMVGETVCVPVTVFNFEAVSSFQFGITFDPAVITFQNANVPNCPLDGGPVFDCIPGLFPFLITNPGDDDVRVAWPSPDGLEKTVADGTQVFELCFEIQSEECGPVSFTNQQIAVEFFGPDGQIPATLINGGINCSDAPMIVDADVQGTSCEGDTDGSISLTITGGANLEYEWSPNVGNGPVVMDLPPGVYTVIVTNPNTNETASATYTVNAPPPFSVNAVDVQDVRCNGEANGSITIATLGGNGPYIIDWSGNLPDGMLQQTNLAAGFYSVTVTDGNGCSRELIDIEVEEPEILVASGSITNISAGTDGAIDLLVNGGTPEYTYNWSGPGGFSAGTEDIAGLTMVGTYCVTVTDSRMCERAQCFQVSEGLVLVDQTINSGCVGANNGSIDITVAGGNGECSFVWTDSEGMVIGMMEDIDGLEPGTYSVEITCGTESINSNFTLFAPTPILANGSTSSSTNGDNGTIDLSPTGGAAPYTFEWRVDGETDIFAMTEDVDGLAPGVYCVTINDQSSCATEECFTIDSQPMSIDGTTASPSLCADSLGSAELIIINGTGPYTAVAQPGDLMGSSDSDTLIIALPAGDFVITVTDGQGNQSTTNVTITAPDAIVVAGTTIVSDTEDPACVGSITLNVEGGSPMYTVSWNQPDLDGLQVSELCAGTYAATITDANGCQQIVSDLNVGELTEEGETTEVACPGDATGSVDLTVAGGVGPYTFSWTEAGSTDVIAETEDLTEVAAGDYTVVITDNTGASLVRTYTISSANGFFVTANVTTDYNGFDVSCAGFSDAQLVAEVSGTGNYTYEWRRNGGLVSMDAIVNDAPAGTYDLRVISEDGCIVDEQLEVIAPSPIELVANITDASCEDARDGRIELVATGGAGDYDYLWEDGRITPAIPFLRPNRYSVEVMDANGCLAQGTFSVNAPEALTATVSSTDADDGCNGTIDVTVNGGNGLYTYEWPQLMGQTGATAEGLCPGVYTIEVSDDARCQTIIVEVTVRDRRFPCLSERNVITPNGDGLNEAFILFCTDGADFNDNVLEIYNRWGQLVYKVNDYDCSQDGGLNCFEGRNNDGSELPEGPYYYILDYANPSGDRLQKRGSLTILRE